MKRKMDRTEEKSAEGSTHKPVISGENNVVMVLAYFDDHLKGCTAQFQIKRILNTTYFHNCKFLSVAATHSENLAERMECGM